MEIPLVDTVAAPEVFVSGLGKIEDIGGCLRFTFYVYEYADGGTDLIRVVKLKLIMAPDAVSAAAAKTLAALDTAVSLDMVH
jgi:hypothetical protein